MSSTTRRVMATRWRACGARDTSARSRATAPTCSSVREFPSMTTSLIMPGMSAGHSDNSRERPAVNVGHPEGAKRLRTLCISSAKAILAPLLVAPLLRMTRPSVRRRARQLGTARRTLVRPIEHDVVGSRECDANRREVNAVGLYDAKHVRISRQRLDRHAAKPVAGARSIDVSSVTGCVEYSAIVTAARAGANHSDPSE